MYWFDEKTADEVVTFFERFLVHVKGRKFAGKPFRLLPWQEKIVRDIFGWKRKDGRRKYRTVYIEVPRKQGKSTLVAGIALYMLFRDLEPGAEIYSCAVDRNQASYIFEIAKEMVQQSPALMQRCRIYRRSIIVPALSATYQPLSADVPTKHGLSAHGVLFDELHAQPNRELWDVMVTSTGAREQPLVIAITTAGYDQNSICWELHDYARKVEAGVVEDPTFYGVIYAADEKDDWADPETWKKANPSFGVIVDEEFYKSEVERAMRMPAYENSFRRFYLNQWVQQETRWMPLKAWDASAGLLKPETLKGKECFGGLDLASTSDLAAFVLVFPEGDKYKVLPYFWIPRENMIERARKDRVPYDVWARQGLIKTTPGNVIDYATIRNDILKLAETYRIREIGYDRWGAEQLRQELAAEGLTMVPVGMGFVSLKEPTKELLRLVLAGKLVHGGNKVLRWMADNVVVEMDAAGNMKPSKAKSREKIDGIVALILAIDRAIRHESTETVYGKRGILTI